MKEMTSQDWKRKGLHNVLQEDKDKPILDT